MHDVRQPSEVAAVDHPLATASPGKSDYATRLAKIEAQLDDLDTYLHLDLGGAVPDAIRNVVEERVAHYRQAVEESAEAAAVAAAQEAVNATRVKVAEMDQAIRTMLSQLATLRAEVKELRQRDHQWMSECLQLRAEQEALRGRLTMVRTLLPDILLNNDSRCCTSSSKPVQTTPRTHAPSRNFKPPSNTCRPGSAPRPRRQPWTSSAGNSSRIYSPRANRRWCVP